MSQSSKLLAWIEPQDGDYLAAFVSDAAASLRPPATRRCASPDEGREWVEQEAASLGTAIEWVNRPRG